jgi:hypothetical protein
LIAPCPFGRYTDVELLNTLEEPVRPEIMEVTGQRL